MRPCCTVFRGFEIDMAYVCMQSFVAVPEDLDVCQTSILQNLDDASVKSLNGHGRTLFRLSA